MGVSVETDASALFALDGDSESARDHLTPDAPHAVTREAPGGVRGGSPARLDTQREIARGDTGAAGSETRPERVSRQVERSAARLEARRHKFGRPVSRPWRAWVADVAAIMRRHGRPEVASSLLHCGELATVYDCADCGRVGRVEVRASCHTRVCPWCSRIAAQKAVQNIHAAAKRVPGYVAEDARKVLAAAILEKHRAAALRDRWKGFAAAALERGDARVAEGHEARALGAEERRRIATRTEHGINTLSSWGWKLITVSPPRRPGDVRSYSPQWLRRAVADVFERFTRLWDEGLSHGGLASAVVRVECSSKGHVHAHVLYYGPWVVNAWARRVAGCIVDVRAVSEFQGNPTDDALREALKYQLKAPSPTRAAWIGGDRWRVTHPELAAAWLEGSRGVQLTRYRGLVRASFEAAEAAGEIVAEDAPAEPPQMPAEGHQCAFCAKRLPLVGRLAPTCDVARALGADWRRALELIESHA